MVIIFVGFVFKGYWIFLELGMLVDESDFIDLMDKGLVLLLIFYGLVFIFIIG